MTYARAALAGLVLLAVAGCSGSDPADGDPTTAPPSPTASPSPTLAPPTIPPEAQEHSADGAAAFVEYWNGLLSYSMASLDAASISQASTASCGGCSAIAKLIQRTSSTGGHSGNPNYRTTVTSSQLLNGKFIVTADLTNDDFVFRESEESTDGRVEATVVHYVYELTWTGEPWQVDALRKQELPR